MPNYRNHTGLAGGATLLLVIALGLSWLGRAGSPPPAFAQENPTLSALQIEIWPEFDRPQVLVILRGEIAPDAALPATVSLRIPVSSGGPAAVASSTSPDAELFNLQYQRADTPEAISLTFTAQQRLFHVEFYDQLQTGAPERSYTYTWPGDFKVEQVTVRVQEPAGATDISTQPELTAGTPTSTGLVYRRGEQGSLEAGQTLPVTISYRKTDARTTAEIIGLPTAPEPEPAASGSDGDISPWLLLPAVAAGLIAGAALATLWHRQRVFAGAGGGGSRAERRRAQQGEPGEGARFCPQCGNRVQEADRFCPRCGTPARKR